MMNLTVNRKHKERLFLLVFRERHDLLSLYNAKTGPTTRTRRSLSSPRSRTLSIWGSKTIYPLWWGMCSIFGSIKALTIEGNSVQEQKEPCLEVKAIMLNINYGKNRELMEQCRKLKEYAQFIERIREYQDSGLMVEEAVRAAVDSCIAQGILADVLSKHRAEVIDVFLTDYDEELRMKVIVNDQVEEKVEEALEEYLTNQIRKKLAKGLSEPEIADMLEIDAAQVEAICKNIREQQEK